MQYANIQQLLGASHPVVIRVVNEMPERKGNGSNVVSLQRMCRPSDMPKGRGGYGFVMIDDWSEGCPFTYDEDGEVFPSSIEEIGECLESSYLPNTLSDFSFPPSLDDYYGDVVDGGKIPVYVTCLRANTHR